MIKIRDIIQELFKDMGRLTDKELQKGKSIGKLSTDRFNEVSGRVFYKIISKIKTNDLAKGDDAKGLDTLSVYSVNEYNKMSCYIGDNNSSGYALSDKNTELVSVFSSQQSSGSAIVQDAIRNGAKHLDCFATRERGKITGQLYSLYSRNGFKIDTSMNSGKVGEPYTIVKGVSDFVNDDGEVEPNNPNVVVFMKK